jgi:hypothetical protein
MCEQKYRIRDTTLHKVSVFQSVTSFYSWKFVGRYRNFLLGFHLGNARERGRGQLGRFERAERNHKPITDFSPFILYYTVSD